MSTKWPSTAAAAAICGETRWVRPPRPCRPSKLRLLVEAQRSPGESVSGFIPRHIEQPALRQSNPAARKTSSRPSSSACAFTCCDPGTTMAFTLPATLRPPTPAPAAPPAAGGPARGAPRAGCGAGPDEAAIELDLLDRRPGPEVHVAQRALL